MSQRKKSGKVTTSHKVALGALSVLGAVAGWNAIGRSQPEAQTTGQEAPAATTAATAATVVTARATPWPTIAPLAEMPRIDARPIPTLVAVAMPDTMGATGAPSVAAGIAAPSLIALPTLAPLPAMPEYVAPPPPPPAPPSQVAAAPPADSGNVGGGS